MDIYRTTRTMAQKEKIAEERKTPSEKSQESSMRMTAHDAREGVGAVAHGVHSVHDQAALKPRSSSDAPHGVTAMIGDV